MARRKKSPPPARRKSRAPSDLLRTPKSAEELVGRVLAAWQARLSPATRRGYLSDLRAYGTWLLPAKVRAACADMESLERLSAAALLGAGRAGAHERVDAWVEHMERRERLSPATINRRLSALRSLVKAAHRLRDDTALPWTLDVRGLPVKPYGRAVGPDSERVENVVAALGAAEGADALRDLAMVLLMYDCGLRRSAVSMLSLADVNLGEPSVFYVPKGAAGEGEAVEKVRKATSRRCADAMRAWIRSRGREPGPLFRTTPGPGRPSHSLSPDSINRIVKERGRQFVGQLDDWDDNDWHAHGLRHSAATKLARERGNVFEIQALLDHASIATTQAYVDRVSNLSVVATQYLAGELEE